MSKESDDEFADALESLSPIAERGAAATTRAPLGSLRRPTELDGVRVSKTDNQARRGRLALVRSRMRNEFGVGASNYGGSQTSFDAVSESDGTSMASWGRRLLRETSADASPNAVMPHDSLSTRASRWVHAMPAATSADEQQPRLAVATAAAAAATVVTSPAIRSNGGGNDESMVTTAATSPRPQPPPLPPRRSEHNSAQSTPATTAVVTNSQPLSRPQPSTSISMTPDRPSPAAAASTRSPDLTFHTPSNSTTTDNDTNRLDSSDSSAFAKSRGHAKTQSLDRGLTLAKSIKYGPFPPPAASAKSSSLNRGVSPSIVNSSSVCEETERINTAHGVIQQLTMSVLSSSNETDDDDAPRSSASSCSGTSKRMHTSHGSRRTSGSRTTPPNVETRRTPPHAAAVVAAAAVLNDQTAGHDTSAGSILPVVDEETGSMMSTPRTSRDQSASLDIEIMTSTTIDLQNIRRTTVEPIAATAVDTATSQSAVAGERRTSSHKRHESCVDHDARRPPNGAAAAFKECRSASALHECLDDAANTSSNGGGGSARKRLLVSKHSIDPITQDVERRMSMKDHFSTRSSSHSGDITTRNDNTPSLQSGIGQARALLRSYSTLATTFVRGAYQRARGVVASSGHTPTCGSLVVNRYDDEILESDAASSSVSVSVSETNAKPYNRTIDGYPLICRPKSAKKGPHSFQQLRVVQELNREHTGAVWCVKFSVCGRLMATAGHDNMVRVWVLRNHLQYFLRLRDKYNGHADGDNKTVTAQDFERIHRQMEKKHSNAHDDDDNSICSRKSPMDSSASTKSCSTQAQSQITATSSSKSDNSTVFFSKPLCIYRGHTADVLDLSFSPKNYFLLSAGMDHTVKLWHLTRSECLCCFQHADYVTCIAFMPKDDRYFISGSMDGKIRLWHIPEKKVALWNEVDQTKFITAITFVRNRFVVVGTYDGRCFFYTNELKYHTVINVRSSRGKNSRGHKITSLAVHGDCLLVTSNDSRIRMYSLADMELVCKFKGAQIERSQIRAMFSPDGKHVICGSEDNYAYIWPVHDLSTSLSLNTGTYERFRAHSSVVTAAVFAPRPQLFYPLLSENPQQLAPVLSNAYSKRLDLVPVSAQTAPTTSNTSPNHASNNEWTPARPNSILSVASARASQLMNDIRRSRRHLLSFRQNVDPWSGNIQGDIIVTADHSGAIKILANPRLSTQPHSTATR